MTRHALLQGAIVVGVFAAVWALSEADFLGQEVDVIHRVHTGSAGIELVSSAETHRVRAT